MAFLTDKQELKPGLVIFRRGDVDHRNWYCRIKLPNADRYKTISLKTADIDAARDRAFDHDADVRFRLKHDVPVFNRPFSQVAAEYVEVQKRRAATGQVSDARWRRCDSVVRAQLNRYVGPTQIHLVGQERWEEYPTWRRENSKGRLRELVSDATIRFEMSILHGVMTYALKKRYISADRMFEGRPKLAKMRRDAFSLEEYRKLHTVARGWIKKANRPSSVWYRTVAYNFILIMCNTGMRPPEAKNLRWRDITERTDREGRRIMVLRVTGKGKARELVAPGSVGDYLDRIKTIAIAKEENDRVFTTHTGEPAESLYKALIGDLLDAANLRTGPSGIPRSTYSFRHTYATFRLSVGIDVYFLAQQMGTSVAMIQDHYGHVNPVKNADRILLGMAGWEPIAAEPRLEAAEDDEASPQQAAAGKTARASRRGSRYDHRSKTAGASVNPAEYPRRVRRGGRAKAASPQEAH